MSRCGLYTLALMMILCLTGCSQSGRFSDADMDVYERIHQYYGEMRSYFAEVRLTVKGNKTENVYELEQYEKGEDKTRTRVLAPERLRGVETVQNGERAQVRLDGEDPRALDVARAEELDYCFVSHFLRLYYQSEETAVQVSAADEGGTTLLETRLPALSARRSRVSMLVDNRTLAPKSITVYDLGGNVVLMAEFIKFAYNEPIDDKIFEIVS